jgi:glycosyltransferase involved in cell wall biosynthesis
MTRHELIKSRSLFISVIVPIYNEEGNVKKFFTELQQSLRQMTDQFEIIAIDDGSRDKTREIIRQLPNDYQVKLLGFSRNFGKETALTAGLENCSGDVAILMDADFQHPLEVLPEFIMQWEAGYEMVYGVRQDRKSESVIKRNFAKLFYWLMERITHIDIPPNAGDFRLLDRKVIDAINSFQERIRFMKGMYAWVGFKKIAVPFDVKERAAGKSSWGFARLMQLAITGIISFSDIPLRVWSFVGFAVSSVALVYAVYFLMYTLFYGADLPGFPSIIVAVMFLGGIQLMSIGILGEYIARIFTEVKHRPKYLLEEKLGFDDSSLITHYCDDQ